MLLSAEESYIMIAEDAAADHHNENEDNYDESAMIVDTLSESIETVSKPKITLLEVEQHLREVQAYIVQCNAPEETTNMCLQISNQFWAHNNSLPRMNPTITNYFRKK